MKILQLTSDWKWTGPAEPMLRLGLALRARGHSVALAAPEVPDAGARSLAGEARLLGWPPDLSLSFSTRPWSDLRDARRLRGFLRESRTEIVHAWHSRDHLLALTAGRGGAALVRSIRRAEPIPPWPWNRWLFGPGTDGLLCVSPESARRNARLRGGRPLRGAFGAVDLERFRPAPPGFESRERLGLGSPQHVVGIVARVQRHRRFDLLLEAARIASRADPAFRLLVVGRGTHLEELAVRPAARLGIADRVVFAGYRNEDYADVLRAMDVFTYLVPGSDGTCRALLEAAACGLPAVVTRRGALAEIVVDGESGQVVDESPQALAHAWQRLLEDPDLRRRMGNAARKRAEESFRSDSVAETAEALYTEALRARAR